jgi:cyclic pyranopterin monophosphate synthase
MVMIELTHFDEHGASRMVDVSSKEVTHRSATASGLVVMRESTLQRVRDRKLAKGDVFEVARLAGIMGAKRVGDLIPLCHPIGIDGITLDFEVVDDRTVKIEATVTVHGRTGVEMEALTAVTVAALTIYDMCKAVDREIRIDSVRLEAKSGGRSGNYRREVDEQGG